VGHLSAGLVHTGNISYRLGALRPPNEIREAIKDRPETTEAFGRMAAHLDANGVDLTQDKLTLGMPLHFDPQAERFLDNPQANQQVMRRYRAPFVVPEKV